SHSNLEGACSMKRLGKVSGPVLLTMCVLVATVTFAAAAEKVKTAATTKTKKAVSGATDKVVAQIDAQIAAANVDKKAAGWKTRLTAPKVVTFDPGKKYFARMVTNKGTLLIELKPKVAPMHVTNFIYLARMGFYDGLKFHRVIKGFMAQGGD